MTKLSIILCAFGVVDLKYTDDRGYTSDRYRVYKSSEDIMTRNSSIHCGRYCVSDRGSLRMRHD